jgi:hypothetical protein
VQNTVQDTVQATLQNYLATLQAPKPDLSNLRQEFADALRQTDQPGEIDRASLVELSAVARIFSARMSITSSRNWKASDGKPSEGQARSLL